MEKEKFIVPKNGEEIRSMMIEHVKKMAEIRWTCSETLDFSKSTDWTGKVVFHPGVQYKGLPYISNRRDDDSDVPEFAANLDENGVYVGPTSWQSMPGTDCGGGPRMAFAWSGALCRHNPGNDFHYDPIRQHFAFGLATVGDYNCNAFDTFRSKSTHDAIMVPNGEAKMFECFAKVRPGDVFFSYFVPGEHIRSVAEAARTVFKDDGTVDGEKSTVRLLEQNSVMVVNDDGTNSTWSCQDFTFQKLFNDGYIPLTMQAYSKDTVEYPEFSTENINISGKVTAHDLLSGRILCNYSMFEVTAVLTDKKTGSTVRGIIYPYLITADLSRMKFSTPLTELATGDYHYTLTAKIGYGEKVILDTDIRFENHKELVIYISDDGKGNGSSPESPLGNAPGFSPITRTSYKNGALYRAVSALSQTGGTVVVCGKTSVISGHFFRYGSSSEYPLPGLPVTGVGIRMTSVYDGVDYRKQGASLTVEITPEMKTFLDIKVGLTWDKIDLVLNYAAGSDRGMIIACGNRKTVFGTDFRVRVFWDGKEAEPTDENAVLFPVLCGGYQYLIEPGNTDLTVLGGTWFALAAGPFGDGCDPYGTLKGNTNVTVGGNALVLNEVCGGTYFNIGSVSGDIAVNVKGGRIRGDIVLAGNSGVSDEESTATLTVSGTPIMEGSVRVIGPEPKNGAPKTRVLDLSGAENGAVLPGYEPEVFTKIIP